MALDNFTKQSWEEFRIDVDFGKNMDAGEKLALGSCYIVATNASGATCTAAIVDLTTMTLINGTSTGMTSTSLQALIRGGDDTNTPYKITFYGVTDLTPPHKWEKDISMKIKEL
jgi:hypothetical protein